MRIRSILSRIPVVLAAAIFSSLSASCEYGIDEFLYRKDSVEQRSKSLAELSGGDAPKIDSDEYAALVITDVHFGGENSGRNGERRDDDFLSEIDALPLEQRPKFCISLGDFAEHGEEGEYRSYKDFTKRLFERGINTYNVVGNHDLYNFGWAHFERLAFPYTSFYRFKTKNFSWYFVDSASGSLGIRQRNALIAALKADASPKVVSMHDPLYAEGKFYFAMQNSTERNLLISAFARNNVKIVLAGHTHEETRSDFGRFFEAVIPGYLERGGYALLTVRESQGAVSCSVRYLAKK